MCPELHPAPTSEHLNEGQMEKLAKYKAYAEKLFDRHVKLIVDPGDSTGIAEQLSSSAIGSMTGEHGQHYVAVVYDSALAGQACSRPHLSIVLFRDHAYARAINGVLMATGDKSGSVIPIGHALFLFGGRGRI